jgi:pimeloyl-ACP methyl ester carboxylesterase
MDGTGDLFYRQAAFFETHYTIETFDLNACQEATWPALVAAVGRQLNSLQALARQPAVVCGESFGACLALATAARFPHRIAALISINPASSFRRQTWLNWSSQFLQAIPDWLYRCSAESGLRWLAELDRIAPHDRDRFLSTIRAVPKAIACHRLDLLRSFDIDVLPLEAIAAPTLLLASGRDRLLPSAAEVHRLAARLPLAAIEELPLSGHACLLERDLNLKQIVHQHPILSSLMQGSQRPISAV